MNKFNFIESPEPPILQMRNTKNGRFYTTEDGHSYPSVTTVLSGYNQKALDEWARKVGHEEAARIGAIAARRGQAIHKLVEDYLKGDPTYLDGVMPVNAVTFNSIKPIFDLYVNNIRYIETSLYSHKIQSSGTVDLVADFMGKISIIDTKTSLKPKKKEWISTYFMQTSAYSFMIEDLFDISIQRIVLIIAVDNEKPQIFIEKRDNYINMFMEERIKYKEIHHV